MINDLHAAFEKFNDDFLNFEGIENKRSRRPDIHAFLLLDELVPGRADMVCAAEHDEIFLEVNPDDLAKAATEDHVLELIRCGVRWSSEGDSLAMFV
jgi:hypothetical protein